MSDGITTIHILPTPERAKEIKATLPATTGALTYHGGPVMTLQSTYAIFWLPKSGKLQNGGATSMSAKYQPVIKQFLADYSGHGTSNNSTQYYQTVGATTTYIKDSSGYVAAYVDTDEYPASGCTDAATPGNCITDAQLQAEIKKVITAEKWVPGPTKMFLVFTSSGEGSCFDGTNASCAYTGNNGYCAYHSYYGSASTPTIYGNEPYGDPHYCNSGTPTPNGDIYADTAVSIGSHEMTEAATDPELDAWWDSANGEEIGDLCAYTYGTLSWDSAKANEMWNGHYYVLQREYDNHVAACVQVGP